MDREELGGLPSKTVAQLRAVFARHPSVEQAILYGSRAKRTHRSGSDIDITLLGESLRTSDLLAIETELDDLLLPYLIDLSLLDQIENESLLEHIRRVGITFYSRKR